MRRALAVALRQTRRVSPRDARAFLLLLDDHADVAAVSAALGMNANQVYQAKSRLLARVRARVTQALRDA
jgi:hypothetical protein